MAPDCWENTAEGNCVGNMNNANSILHVRLSACLFALSACAVSPTSANCTGHRALGIGEFGPTIHVVIGPGTLGVSSISINFLEKNMCVLKERPDGPGIPFINGADGHPAIAVAVDNTKFLAVIDSGSPDLLTLTTEWIDMFDFIEPPEQSGHSMTVAGLEFENPELTFVVGQAQPLFGMKGLANFEIILDYEVAQSWTNAIDVSGRQIKSAETE